MELWPAFAQLHSLEVLTALTAVGIGWEMSSGRRASGTSPQVAWLFGFLAWAYAVTVARLGFDKGFTAGWGVTLGPIFMLLVTYALRRIERLRAMMVALLACGLFVSAVTIHQGVQPRQCVELHVDPSEEGEVDRIPDGRECEGPRICEEDGVPGSDYICERAGLFETFSTQGRVRWRGQLDDPNEVAVVIGALIPFMFMFGVKSAGSSRTMASAPGYGGAPPYSLPQPSAPAVGATSLAGPLTLFVIAVMLVLGLWSMVYTQSRGGQLVLATVMIIMLVRRFGWWSIVAGAAITLPIVLLSWRSGADAESSTAERAEILSEGLLMLKAHPIIGIGVAQFALENPMNMAAHNSYLLVATELGFPGFLVWWGLVWTTVKVPALIALRPPPGLDPVVVRFAEALAASTVGLHIGIFFLSFVYKHIYFVWLGLSGALYGAVREHHPQFEVRLTSRDYGWMVVLSIVSIAAVRGVSMGAR